MRWDRRRIRAGRVSRRAVLGAGAVDGHRKVLGGRLQGFGVVVEGLGAGGIGGGGEAGAYAAPAGLNGAQLGVGGIVQLGRAQGGEVLVEARYGFGEQPAASLRVYSLLHHQIGLGGAGGEHAALFGEVGGGLVGAGQCSGAGGKDEKTCGQCRGEVGGETHRRAPG